MPVVTSVVSPAISRATAAAMKALVGIAWPQAHASATGLHHDVSLQADHAQGVARDHNRAGVTDVAHPNGMIAVGGVTARTRIGETAGIARVANWTTMTSSQLNHRTLTALGKCENSFMKLSLGDFLTSAKGHELTLYLSPFTLVG